MRKKRTVGEKFNRKYEPFIRKCPLRLLGRTDQKSQPLVRKCAQNAHRRTEIQPKKSIGNTKCEPLVRNATENSDRRTEKKLSDSTGPGGRRRSAKHLAFPVSSL